ncbi:MAG: hypothetical protein IJJ33_03435 [Victivallales bacterium]|nr:hypothetical protein [Victivallales bacterium]
MTRSLLLILLFALACPGCLSSSPIPSSSSLFAPTYRSDAEDKYFDAMEIYESSPSAPQGVYHWQGLVYVIVTIDTNKEKLKYLEGTAMLRVQSLLCGDYQFLPRNFTLRNRVLEKGLDDETGVYRYAVVFRERDIRKLMGASQK